MSSEPTEQAVIGGLSPKNAGTNVNSMVLPGFVAEVRTRFDKPGDHLMPCHEYCSVGHEGMWARVKVVERAEYARAYGAQPRASCVPQ